MFSKAKFGIDVFLDSGKYKNSKNIGLVCNSASITSSGIHTRFALLNDNHNIVKLFSPEHGFNAKGEDGKYIENTIDAETNIPIISLYSDKLCPTLSDLENIDVIIIDLPDIGARFYTYLWTATYVMESCERYNIPVILLDRPNPIVKPLKMSEGPILDINLSSFIGRFPIPITHNCTIAELSSYFQAKYFQKLNLDIVKMENWNRQFPNNYLFTPTSPAIRDFFTTKIYPGTCLFEGLNINEGRGTEFPFTQFGAPWLDNEKLFLICNNFLTGAVLKKIEYTPIDGLYKDEICYGLKVENITDQFNPVQYFIDLINILHDIHPNEIKERNYCTNVNPTGDKHLDKLIGLKDSFTAIKNGTIDTSIRIEQWIDNIEPFLLY